MICTEGDALLTLERHRWTGSQGKQSGWHATYTDQLIWKFQLQSVVKMSNTGESWCSLALLLMKSIAVKVTSLNPVSSFTDS